ncbi:MAG: hypothetical protein RMK35_02580 [Aquificaceae bacterium]|nr:hypothetical protein [Aquificaceae bacterium]
MIREPIKLLFLIFSYNFILYYISDFSPVALFPSTPEDVLMVLSFSSALYLAWLFGYRDKTVPWFAYLYAFLVIGLFFLRGDYHVITGFLPSILLTMLLTRLFETPAEVRLRELKEERKKLEEELSRNEKEISELLEQMELLKEFNQRLEKEKSMMEREYLRLKEEEQERRKELDREREELNQRLKDNQKKLQEYKERLERLTSMNKELFEMLEVLWEKESKGGKDELSKLRQDRKKLSKEIVHLYELLDEVSKENQEIKREVEVFKNALDREKEEKELLKLEVERLKAGQESRKEVYKEIFSILFENIEVEDKALKDFLQFDRETKREFLKELLLLNMKGQEERFESMKGYKNVFKLKPRGGRIYFTFGEDKTWKVIGMLRGEDDKLKDRHTKELLVKYKS